MTCPVVLFSAGLDSAVLLVQTAARYRGAQPVYVRSGLAWEFEEQAYAERFLAALPASAGIRDLVVLDADMRDVYPATHWAIRGEAPGFDTPDMDVYLEGRNVVLLSKTAIFAARTGSDTIVIGPLAGNPFPDARPEFFTSVSRALSLGLNAPVHVEAPFLALEKSDVIRLGAELGVRFELTLSCMQPARVPTSHCGRCSKCRERKNAFAEAGLNDPAFARAHATSSFQPPPTR